MYIRGIPYLESNPRWKQSFCSCGACCTNWTKAYVILPRLSGRKSLGLDLRKPRKVSPAYRFSDESRWCEPKGDGLSRFPREVRAFPSKTKTPYLSCLWSEKPFSEDTNMVSKLLCMILLYVSSYLLSTGVFMSVLEVYRSVIACRFQVISPGDVP